MRQFKCDDESYESWCAENPRGFVFNRFGGTNPIYNVLHRVNCPFLWRECDSGARTVVEKWCNIDEMALASSADHALGPGMWKRCGVCFRASESVPAIAIEARASIEHTEVFVAGEPAVFATAREAAWKSQLAAALMKCIPSFPIQWLDVTFLLTPQKLFNQDIDNLLTPLLDAACKSGWLRSGFAEIGSVTSRKICAEESRATGVRVIACATLPTLKSGASFPCVAVDSLKRLDEATVKWALYDRAYEMVVANPTLIVPPLTQISVDVHVTVADSGRRKSLQALMKPCIDGLEPILGNKRRLPSVARASRESKALAPQDEMIVEFELHVRGGATNGVAAWLSTL